MKIEKVDWHYFGLDALIKFLEEQPEKGIVPIGFQRPHSYRGYYEDLAFEPKENATVAEMLAAAKSALGTTYEGYKGGSFPMAGHTTCWIAHYGDSGAQQIGHLLMLYMFREV